MVLTTRINRTHFGLELNRFFSVVFKWRLNDLLASIVILVIFAVLDNAAPFQRQFYINDLSIGHPFAEHERITTTQLFIFAVVVPFLVLVILGLALTNEQRVYTTWITFVGFVATLAVNSFLTSILKNWLGRPRPDFVSRCDVRDGTPKDTLVNAADVCQQTDIYKLRDGFRSCPSGHSSTSFAGLGYLTFWLVGQTLAYHKRSGAWRTWFSFIPALFAGLIAISRTEDYRHRYSDVAAGTVIGVICAYWGYKRNFPNLNTSLSYIPVQLIEENKLENFTVKDFDDGSLFRDEYFRAGQMDIESQRRGI